MPTEITSHDIDAGTGSRATGQPENWLVAIARFPDGCVDRAALVWPDGGGWRVLEISSFGVEPHTPQYAVSAGDDLDPLVTLGTPATTMPVGVEDAVVAAGDTLSAPGCRAVVMLVSDLDLEGGWSIDGHNARVASPWSAYRRLSPWTSALEARRVVAAVVDALRNGGKTDLADRVALADAEASITAIGLDLENSRACAIEDWRATCAWVAARISRDFYPRLALAGMLAAHLRDVEDREDRGDLAVLACSILDHGSHQPWHQRAKLARLIAGERASGLTAEEEARVKAAADDILNAPEPSLRVLDRIPDGIHDAKRLKERFGHLLAPLPLAPLPDVESLESSLLSEFPWMAPAIERIASDLRLARLLGARAVRIRPFLLVGPPGVGKSRFARRVAQLVGTPFGVIAAGGSTDSRSLAGTATGWGSATPSSVLLTMAAHGHAGPLMLVDEIDKAGGSDQNGRLHDTLLAMLEPETSRRWPDECLGGCADLSGVSWLLTANVIDTLPEALVTRIGVVEVGLPGAEAFDGVLVGVLADIAEEYGAGRDQAETLRALLVDEAVEAMRRTWADGGTPRRLRGQVQAALAAAARHTGRH